MAYGIVHFFRDGTKEQYEASIGSVHPSRSELPAGQIFHAAGPSAGGWTIVAIHDSRESWETFRDEILLPRLQAGIEGGFDNPPEEQASKFTSSCPRAAALGKRPCEGESRTSTDPRVSTVRISS